jgi:hypothetical protein
MKKGLVVIVLAILCFASTKYYVGAHSMRALQEVSTIRDIFLTVPWPKGEKESVTDRATELIGDAKHRRSLLDKAQSGADQSVVDTANGYLRIYLEPTTYVVMTYFNKSNNDRLVVLQVADSNTPNANPMTDNYLFTLSHGQYKSESLNTYLPKIELTDFWGTQPLPRPALRKMINNSFYIEWPRKGTIASVIFDEPDFDVESKEVIELEKNMSKRQFDRIELIWDKESGVFKKGRKTKDRK